MELEVYIHGNPTGFKYLGPAKEKDSFFQRFYNRTKSVGKELIIESAQPYYYYTYLFCKNVLDTNGRPNSYFGITIRFDAYYKSAANLYTLLDTLCNKWVIGNLLKGGKGGFQYVSNELTQNVYESIQSDLVDWIRRAIDDTDLLNLQNISYINNQEGKLNLIDCSSDNIRKYMQKYGAISISPDYPLLRESEHETRIQTLNRQWKDKWNDLQSKHDAAISNAQGLNGTIQALQDQLSQAKNNLLQIQKEYDDYKSKNNLSYNIINGLKEEKQALLKLAGFVDSLGIEQSKIHGDQRKNSFHGNRNNDRNKQDEDDDVLDFNIKRYLPYIILAIVLVLIVWFLFSLNDCSNKGFSSFREEDKTRVAEFVEQPKENPISEKETTKEAGQKTEEILVDGEIVESDEVNKTETIDYNTLTIDVAEFTKVIKYMTKNSAYTIRICDNLKFKPAEGIKGCWKIQDSDFYIGNPNSTETTITPRRSGNDLELQFFVDGYGTPLKRTIVVKE